MGRGGTSSKPKTRFGPEKQRKRVNRRHCCDACVDNNEICDSLRPCGHCAVANRHCHYSYSVWHLPKKELTITNTTPFSNPKRGRSANAKPQTQELKFHICEPSLTTKYSAPGHTPSEHQKPTLSGVESPDNSVVPISGWESKESVQWLQQRLDFLTEQVRYLHLGHSGSQHITIPSFRTPSANSSLSTAVGLGDRDIIKELSLLQQTGASLFSGKELSSSTRYWETFVPHPTRSLKSTEDYYYHPSVVRDLTQLCYYTRAPYHPDSAFRRFDRKLAAQQVHPFFLNALLSTSASFCTHPYLTALNPGLPREAAGYYAQRAKQLLWDALEQPDMDSLVGVYYLIWSLVVSAKNTESFNIFPLGSDLSILMELHLIDSPVSPSTPLARSGSPASILSSKSPKERTSPDLNSTSPHCVEDDPLMKECKRRMMWATSFIDLTCRLFSGDRPRLTLNQIQVNPINDEFLEQLYSVPVEQDIYPCIIPPTDGCLWGYDGIAEYYHLLCEVTMLQADVLDRKSVSREQYLDLNARCFHWYSTINPLLRFPKTLNLDSNSETPLSWLCSLVGVHLHYHTLIVIMNSLPRVVADSELFNPETDPTCTQLTHQSIVFVMDRILPFQRGLPPIYTSGWSMYFLYNIALRLISNISRLNSGFPLMITAPMLTKESIISLYHRYLQELMAHIEALIPYNALAEYLYGILKGDIDQATI
ncbi:hypothetical protein IWQ62_005146, partial [Dispira parvispora]